MSMTENKAKKNLELLERCYRVSKNGSAVHEVLIEFVTLEDLVEAIKALEEVQAYRAIGTVEELKTAMLYVSLAKIHGTVGRAIDACAEYESIGTIEEFKALKEKNEPKKMSIGNDNGKSRKCCGNCRCFVLPTSNYCSKCGQKLDWQ